MSKIVTRNVVKEEFRSVVMKSFQATSLQKHWSTGKNNPAHVEDCLGR